MPMTRAQERERRSYLATLSPEDRAAEVKRARKALVVSRAHTMPTFQPPPKPKGPIAKAIRERALAAGRGYNW